MSSGSFENVINNVFVNHIYIYIYLIYGNKQDLTLNNLQWLQCHKIKQNKTKLIILFNINNFLADSEVVSSIAIYH